MIYTVTFNPSLDYTIHVENFELGKVNRTVQEDIYAGGKGINVSMVLKNLGYETTAFGFLSGFTGQEIERLLKEKGISTEFIHIENGTSRINLKIRSDVESEINGMGPVIRKEDLELLYEQLDTLKDDDVLVLAGSIPSGMPQSIYRDIMSRLQSKRIKIAVDATKDLLMNVLAYHPFVIKPNNHELSEIFDIMIDSKEKAVVYAKELQKKGAQNVIVSMAGEGAVVVDVGINMDPEGNLCGDVDFEAVEPIVDAITPVPGGVGAVTSTVLSAHTVEAALRAQGMTDTLL